MDIAAFGFDGDRDVVCMPGLSQGEEVGEARRKDFEFRFGVQFQWVNGSFEQMRAGYELIAEMEAKGSGGTGSYGDGWVGTAVVFTVRHPVCVLNPPDDLNGDPVECEGDIGECEFK